MEPADPTATRTVVLRNTAPGGRYAHATTGPVMVPAGGQSEPVEMREGELADLPDGLEVVDPDQADETEQADPAATTPADLADPDSRDGLVSAAKLREIAQQEGVETVKGDDSKAEIVAKIVAHREAQTS